MTPDSTDAAKAARSARIRAQRAERLAGAVERRAHACGRTGPYLAEARRLRVAAVRHLIEAQRHERAEAELERPAGMRVLTGVQPAA